MPIEVAVVFPVVKPTEDTCLPVAILNQNVEQIALIAAGGTYPVVQLSELVDDEDNNTTTVLDTI